MGDTIQFVDAISLSPSIRLDLNEGTRWRVRSFNAPPPRLRRAMVSNAMTDGAYVASSSYDSRVLTMVFDLITDSQDVNAYEWQRLARELDRPTNIIRYQPEGMGRPVFFKTWRSDATQVTDMFAAVAYRQIEVEIVAEPFALGARETFTGSISMDGAGSGLFLALPSIMGDAAAPLRFDLFGGGGSPWHLVTQQFPSAYTAPIMARATNNGHFTLGTDATGTTGAGTIYWNADYIGVSFATATNQVRASATVTLPAAGTYRVLAKTFLATAAATIKLQARRKVYDPDSATYTVVQTGSQVTMDTTASVHQTYDLGLFRVPFGDVGAPSATIATTTYWEFLAERTSGTGTLLIDAILFVPVIMDGAYGSTWLSFSDAANTTGGTPTARIDGETQSLVYLDGATVTELTAAPRASGAFPVVAPQCSNSLWLIPMGGLGSTTFTTSANLNYSASYLPRYLHVRPIAS